MRVPLTARRLLVLTSVCVLGLMAGCTPSPSTSPEDTPEPDSSVSSEATGAAGPTVKPSCALVPESVIKQILNLDVKAPVQTSTDNRVQCVYPPVTGEHTVNVQFDIEQDTASFADRRDDADNGGEPTGDVSGLGDEAYQSSVEFGDSVTNTMVARKGTVSIQVDAVASLDAEKALITKLFTSLA